MPCDSDVDPDSLIGRGGQIRWRIVVPRVSFAAFVHGRALTTAPLVRQVQKRFSRTLVLCILAGLTPAAVALVYGEVFVLLHYGSARFGYFRSADAGTLVRDLFLVAVLTVAARILIQKAFQKRVLNALYKASLSEPTRRGLLFGDNGVLIVGTDVQQFVPWNRMTDLVNRQGDWFLLVDPLRALILPEEVLSALPDQGRTLLRFVRDKIRPDSLSRLDQL